MYAAAITSLRADGNSSRNRSHPLYPSGTSSPSIGNKSANGINSARSPLRNGRPLRYVQ
ncbi:hypothetical protein psb1_0064 [Shigella phage pSb-1]|uniref:Uncharacterized protein n=1 Tax=Shigella phage pSb-1 TaxID=1414738 RepID=V5URD1_9CAUD|nr:hypothetical protein psb1_0064 [Shigella phage pSb-1]AHB79482.1 hypothetical protein psb1_0064 [Shigella phage pSb-1]